MEKKTVGAVANAFIEKDENITLLKLLKLCYIAQGFSLAILDRPIFNDEVIEAWQYGPVIPSLYHEFKHQAKKPLGGQQSIISELKNDFTFNDVVPKLTDKNDKKIIDIVWNWYGKFSANELVDMTHKRGTPWDLTYVAGENKIISNELIKKYYDILVDNIKKRHR